jgi:sugar transferase EpsL
MSPLLKRTLDIAVAGPALLLALPVMALVAVGVRLTLGSPVVFRQCRAGQGERHFTLAKFKTMTDAGPRMSNEEERLTRCGRWLRRSSLDELPQLWSVLKGDMSLVGPRPLPVAYLPRYSAEQRRRHEVPPGLTGWAQIHGRNAITWEERLALDVWYVDHRSFALDVRILLSTVRNVVGMTNVTPPGGQIMEEFKGR